MTARMMMHVSGKTRTLCFDARDGGALPLLTSAATSWAGLPFEIHRMAPTERSGDRGPINGECGVLVVMAGHVDIVTRRAGRETTLHGVPGATSFLSGEERANVVRVTGEAKVAAVGLPSTWFERLQIAGAPAGFGRSQPLTPDETVRSLVRTMCDEVARGAITGRLFAESLSTALLSYAIERVPPSSVRAHGSLSELQCRRLRNYILERLHEDLTLTELSELVGLHPRHFSTLFRRAFGVTPHRYVIDQRLAEGARLLSSGGQDIADIAFRVGFSSQSHFAAAFRQAFGKTPRTYAAEKRVVSAVF